MATKEELYDEADRLKDAGDLEAAAAKFKKCIEAASDYALAHSAMAVVQQKLGNHEDAIEHAKKVCELEPTDPFSFTALSVTFQRAFAGSGNQAYIQMAEDAMAKAHMLQGQM